MGSAKINNITNMADEKKKSIKGLIKNIFGKKKDKCKEKETEIDKNKTTQKEDKKAEQVTVEALLQNFKKLEIEKREEDELKNFSYQKVSEEDELENFTFKVIEAERKTERTDSHSSQDSGFSERDDVTKEEDGVIAEAHKDIDDKEADNEIKPQNDVKQEDNDVKKADNSVKKEDIVVKDEEGRKTEEELLEGLENLKIDEGKKKKSQLVPVARTPIRNRAVDFVPSLHPYGQDHVTDFRQINQVNKQTWSGGQVTVSCRDFPVVSKQETNLELQNFSDGLALRGVQLEGIPFELDLIDEYITENTPSETDLLEDFIKDPNNQEHIQTITTLVENEIQETNPIEELENTNHLNYEQIANLDSLIGFEEDKLYTNMYPTPPSAETAYSPKTEQFYTNFLTPPRSDIASSPMSDSTYPILSDYTLSPHSDCEKYQEIPSFEEPQIEQDGVQKERERNTSTSSMSMKNFKDLQRELAGSFSKKECCEINRKPCKQVFQEHLKKLSPEERKRICVKVSGLDLKTTYGILHQVLLSLSRGTPDVDLHLALFALLCDRVMAERPQLFLEDFGLSVLKAAVLRCGQRPELTRYVVWCVRLALRLQPNGEDRDFVFKEVDALGDTLVTACARGGDEFAPALAELLMTSPHAHAHAQIPLFNVHHANTEGYSALQVACREHSASSSRLHTVHVLLEHGHADVWKGDVKGGDTAVHMAVNSAHCDLRLVLLLFRQLDRKLWKKLAHVPNRSSVTPLDYARCAAKSTSRQNYPTEVLDFLKKCR